MDRIQSLQYQLEENMRWTSNIYYNHRLKEQVWEWSYPVKEFSLFHTECYLIIYFNDDKVIDIREWTPGF